MKRCLIIDDSSVVRKVAKRILSTEGYSAAEASSGHEGLIFFRAEPFDMILLDTSLPDISPVEFIGEIRRSQATARPRIVICLAELDVPTIMRAKRAGADGYVLKPFDRQQLLKRIQEMNVAA